MTTRVDSAGVYNDLSGLASLKRDATKAQDSSTLREVAKQFESLFTRQMLKSMREANFGDSLLGSDQQSFYQGMYDDQLAIELSKGRGLGLADMLVKQLTQAGLVPKEAAAANDAGSVNAASSASQGLPIDETRSSGAVSGKPRSFPLGRGGDANGAGAGTIGTDRAIAQGVSDARASGAAASGAPRAGAADDGGTDATAAWRPANKDEFIRDLWPAAEQAGKELGVDPNTLLAHAALESNWGRSMPRDAQGNASFNLFGIKAGSQWTGDVSVNKTLEVENGVAVSKRARFRSYDSPVESFKDYVALLRNNPRYTAALNTGDDAHAFATALQKGGYATDPAYAQKVASIARNMSSSTTALKFAAAQPMNTDTRTL